MNEAVLPEGHLEYLSSWSDDADDSEIHDAYLRLADNLATLPNTRLQFHHRPGVSASLRATLPEEQRPLYALVDLVETTDGRFLSVCFYADTVTDPAGLGNLVPEGLLSEDGYCFDLDSADEDELTYIEMRIAEAYDQSLDFSS